MRRDFSFLTGLTLTGILVNTTNDTIKFITDTGQTFKMYHQQDCCERVEISDVCGDLQDLVGSPILQAEESCNSDDPSENDYDESYTWTFYKLATIKGSVTIRWFGSSNGCYSESVDFEEETN